MSRFITSKDSAENEVKVVVVKPGPKELEGARLYMNQVFRKSVESGAYFREKIFEIMRDQGMWNDAKQKQMEELQKGIDDNVTKLSKGGVKVSEGKQIALDVRRDRMVYNVLTAYQRRLDQFTVEHHVEDANLDYLVSVCVKNESGDKAFTDIEDYKNKSSEPWVVESASALAEMVYDLKQGWEKELPENAFLLKFGFMNDKLELAGEVEEEVKVEPVLGEFILDEDVKNDQPI